MDNAFSINSIEKFLSPFHSDADKDRILKGLAQFTDLGQLAPTSIDAEQDVEKISARLLEAYFQRQFYSQSSHKYFLQGDIIPKVRFPVWRHDSNEYKAGLQDSIIISNACDCDPANTRLVPKHVGLVPVYSLSRYIQGLRATTIQQLLSQGKAAKQADDLASQKVDNISRLIKLQRFTNIFFLPASNDKNIEERIAILDRPFYYDLKDWRSNYEKVLASREATLAPWAYYLFVFKLSFHLCRLPEEPERRD